MLIDNKKRKNIPVIIKKRGCTEMYAKKIAILTACISLFSASCSKTDRNTEKQTALKQEKTAITHEQLSGDWKMVYGGNYGYEFRFKSDHKTIIILFLNEQTIIFKGVCTIDENNMLIFSISEIKNEENTGQLNTASGFTATKGSKFLFNAEIKDRGKILVLKPISIVIDNSNSDGYFEPVMKLNKI